MSRRVRPKSAVGRRRSLGNAQKASGRLSRDAYLSVCNVCLSVSKWLASFTSAAEEVLAISQTIARAINRERIKPAASQTYLIKSHPLGRVESDAPAPHTQWLRTSSEMIVPPSVDTSRVSKSSKKLGICYT